MDIPKVIDIEKAIRSSSSKFVSSLPGFVVRLIEKFVYQDEMNECIARHSEKSGVPFINDILDEWKVKIVIKGGENVPGSGRFVFVANHPVGGIDALSFLSTIYRFFPDVISPSNQLFNYIPNLHPVILGVNVFGSNTRETAGKFNRLFESGSQIMIFPAGIVSRRAGGVISDLPWQKTFVTKSVKYNRDIIPVHISGRNSNLFYVIAGLRKLLGIKMSVEIVLLPREMMKQRNSTVTFTIGKPIPRELLAGEGTDHEWALKIRTLVYNLPEKNDKNEEQTSWK
jgi:putative hemolysin